MKEKGIGASHVASMYVCSRESAAGRTLLLQSGLLQTFGICNAIALILDGIYPEKAFSVIQIPTCTGRNLFSYLPVLVIYLLPPGSFQPPTTSDTLRYDAIIPRGISSGKIGRTSDKCHMHDGTENRRYRGVHIWNTREPQLRIPSAATLETVSPRFSQQFRGRRMEGASVALHGYYRYPKLTRGSL